MADYRFVTCWRLKAPIEPVWQAISQADHYPEWWPGVERVEVLEPANADGLGGIQRSTWKSRLPYRLTFYTRVVRRQPPRLLEVAAWGELEGSGRWDLVEEGAVTSACYTWKVRTTGRVMNLLAPLLRRPFEQNHDAIMEWGRQGLANLLDAAVVEE
jgi:uncharacterized protein YndB with AHSA1/START domain